MAEISDEELRVFRGSKALLDKLLSGKTRDRAEKLVKEHFPETNTVADMAEPYVAPIKEEIQGLRKEFKEYREAVEGAKLDSLHAQRIQKLKRERDFTDEGIKTLEKMMIDKQIPDIEVAADHWERQNPPKAQETSILSPPDWGFGRKTDDPDLKLLFEDEDAWADKEARKVIAEETAKKGQILT